jgi:hypothetical protein
MESWYEVATKDWAIQNEFVRIWMEHGGPKDAALFAEHDFRTKITYFYFSPEAARIAFTLVLRYHGAECVRPDLDSLVLVVGDQSATEGSC